MNKKQLFVLHAKLQYMRRHKCPKVLQSISCMEKKNPTQLVDLCLIVKRKRESHKIRQIRTSHKTLPPFFPILDSLPSSWFIM